jgi:fumarate reductase flavoprotein subunit
MKRDFDVIVIGSGGAGLAAAVTAADHGARVLLVEAGDAMGGSTALSTGVFYAAGTSVQRARGIEDSADAMFQYCMTLSQYRAEASLVRRLSDDSAEGLEWLISLGVQYLPENLYVSGVDNVARGHRPVEYGAGIVAALDQAASTRGVVVSLRTRVRRLLMEQGAVAGIDVDGDAVYAGAVVVATGGFGRNRELLTRHYPDAAIQDELTWYIGGQHSRGDGLAMGQQVGAALSGHNCGLLEITAGFVRDPESYLPGWLMFVNRDGRRFVNETAAYAVMSGVVKSQIGGEAIVVFDEQARQSARAVTTYKRLFENWVPDRLAQFAQEGKLTVSSSIEEMAEKIGIRQDTLATTVDRYNRDCDAGEDTLFFKAAANLKPIRTPPFYAARVRPAILVVTGTGLRIDSDAHVLDGADRSIPGLFAAGETTGGVIGERYYGGGVSIANNIVFGRLAGQGAAACAAQ